MQSLRGCLFQGKVLVRPFLRPRVLHLRSVGVCRVHRLKQGESGRGDVEGEESYEMPEIEQFSAGGMWNISPREWRVLKRVSDQLFPEGSVNWGEFWMNDDYDDWYDDWQRLLKKEGGLHPSIPRYEESIDGQRMWLLKAMKYLETRSDYCETMQFDWAAGTEPDPEPTPAKEFDPDWDDWDFRAMMEKRKARERARREWRQWQREEVGKYQYIDTMAIDSRVPDDVREQYNWTDEEAWDVITQKGRAFDPRKDKGPWLELNPDELPDWAGQGNEYVEEIDDYMKSIGRMVDSDDFFEKENARLAGRPFPVENKDAGHEVPDTETRKEQ